ncbi:MAG: D-sedoheptulose 7-phosphate isomerase [Holosporaceae bacterium]|nr:MAG: D-sedoheptulose 7-phosphate isomerase [Holosporaceae bacterium]
MTSFNPTAFLESELNEHQEVLDRTRDMIHAPFKALLDTVTNSLKKGGKILFFGNGGSAGDAQHLATELVVRYRDNRVPIPAIALTTDTSALTAIGNDLGFDHLFSRQIEALGNPGDIALGITTSGQSPNVIKGFEMAKKKGLLCAGLTGKDGGKLVGLCDPLIIIPSNTTARIQEMHIFVGQLLCDALEKNLGLKTEKP